MECSKCGIKLPNNSNYCIRCGQIFDSNTYTIKEEKVEDVLFDYLIDKKMNFSIGYLFFNYIYAFYKRMYIEGIISFVSIVGLITIVSNFFDLMIESLGFNFLLYFFLILIFLYIIINYIFKFDDLYRKHIYFKINRIAVDNKGATLEELKSLCNKQCDDSIFMAIISIILTIIFTIILNN